MATRLTPLVPLGEETGDAALRQSPWRKRASLSSMADAAERFLEQAGFDRGPWLVVALVAGIAAWFVLADPIWWVTALAGALFVGLGAVALWKGRDDRGRLMVACLSLAFVFAAGVGVIWARSTLVGVPGIERPFYGEFDARILDRIEQPAEARTRLVLAMRHPETGEAMRVRVNLPIESDDQEFSTGAVIRLSARLMPPAPPMLPGSYNFARTAWFNGLAATGSVTDQPVLIQPSEGEPLLAEAQRRLSAHVRSQVQGAGGSIAATLASGDRGAISAADEDAMRDSGLTHLLSISGLHVSALIGATYLLTLRLLAFWPWLVLRVRLPLLAAVMGAAAGIGYTLLTGAEVPTVRSCLAALLVLGALAMGREPLSLRMVAVAAVAVLLLWPESLAGPSFQMSFSAVIAIIALSGAEPVRRFLAPREESLLHRYGRRTLVLLLTGFVIEMALMPTVLYHFHRGGFYGALANVVGIPLVTFISMPLIAISLFLDIVGLGGPTWWLAGKSLDLLLWIAHFTASQPGAVKLMPQMGQGTYALFLFGGLWLALWKGRSRLLGFVPVALGCFLLAATPVPDILISSDGRHVGVTGEAPGLLVLRESRSSYVTDNLMELAGVTGEQVSLQNWPGAVCNPDFCVLTLYRGGRDWHVLMSRSRALVAERDLAAACERVDIVVSERWLPQSCRPRWLKADRRYLEESGGLAIVLDGQRIDSVAHEQGKHGWWRGRAGD
ncbi:ComEC family competence protein [Altererythrobacter sp. KTW20L]|uniref:ComEC/Rec2 family competence protein n=1 Tax=Altererythrobacter sp. KTW20L TaxID=2942210 RepID=UPI0020BF5C05|nr:ComEC/Rec2 family competence protein [Altererythrobacter sp. KTW20L]MCL6251933.1 ComEC family competence protein [Altererythrobacter sp. KTW20L]